jgi:hypothetical protein
MLKTLEPAKNILIVSFEDERWGIIRLVKPLEEAGFAVAALAPPNDALTLTSYLKRHYALDDLKNARRIEAALAEAMRDWRPSFVIPGDERAVAFLHALLRRAEKGERLPLDARSLSTLAASLGDANHHNSLLMKSETVALARRLALRTPESASASSTQEAEALALRIGFPVYVKQSFSWAGQGVIRCDTPQDVANAFASMQPRGGSLLYAGARRLLRRDWYPVGSKIDIQQAIAGTPAFFAAFAWKGRMLAGFAGFVERSSSANGPSCVVRLAAHEEMAQASSALIAATRATGFIGFDFMIEDATGDAYLLECNPRPVQVCHLGARIGVDLSAALATAMQGGATACPTAEGEEIVALFPQEWRRDPAALADFPGFVDAPLNDPALLARMTQPKEESRGSIALAPWVGRLAKALVSGNASIRTAPKGFPTAVRAGGDRLAEILSSPRQLELARVRQTGTKSR